jgi:hypothetical protein
MRDFNYTVNVLVQAYLNGTLEHCNCSACAVGNIIADVKKVEPVLFCNQGDDYTNRFSDGSKPLWNYLFCSTVPGKQDVSPSAYFGEVKSEIDSTGYTWQELAKIEYAFELHRNPSDEDTAMFNGLMAVVDVLAEIHEISLEQKEQAKLLFQ